MIVYNLYGLKSASYKVEQLKSIGLTPSELANLNDVISNSYQSVEKENYLMNEHQQRNMKFSNMNEVFNPKGMFP